MFLAKFRFNTAENEPANNLQNFVLKVLLNFANQKSIQGIVRFERACAADLSVLAISESASVQAGFSGGGTNILADKAAVTGWDAAELKLSREIPYQ